MVMMFFVMQKTAYEKRISYWSSDVCSSDLLLGHVGDIPVPAAESQHAGTAPRLVRSRLNLARLPGVRRFLARIRLLQRGIDIERLQIVVEPVQVRAVPHDCERPF